MNENKCICGEPETAGTTHRTDGPCYIAERATKTEGGEAVEFVPDTSQDWAKLDGAVAWHLIERHADSWDEVGSMMESWLAARATAQAAPATPAPADLIALLRKPEGVVSRGVMVDAMKRAADLLEQRATPAPAAPQAVQAPTEQTQQGHVMPRFAAPAGQHDAGELARRLEITQVMLEQERMKNAHLLDVMMSVYRLAPRGEDIRLPDGRVFRFNDPNAAETLNALGRAIHAIPEKAAQAMASRFRAQGGITSDESTAAPSSTEARATAAEDARDADRYRWLRDAKANVAQVLDKKTDWIPPDEVVPGVGGYWVYEYRAGDELDEAIDAAMRTTSQEPASGTEGGAA
jgi:hypothetical protein